MHWVMHGERFRLICAEDKSAAVKTATRCIIVPLDLGVIDGPYVCDEKNCA